MFSRTLEIHWNVDDAAMSHGESAYLWFSMLAHTLLPDETTEIAGHSTETPLDPYSRQPQGEPGQLYGLAQVTRLVDSTYEAKEQRNLSTEGWAWLRAELARMPARAFIQIGRLSREGLPVGEALKARAEPVSTSPGWLVLDVLMPVDRFTDPATGGEQQRLWLGALREIADVLNPGFGHIDYWRGKGQTALERYSGPDLPVDQRRPQLSVAFNRQRLRGYSWLTITSPEVAARLGGADTLAATGAFAEVESLAGGGLWLLATTDFNDWGMPAAEAIFAALAPALPPGAPVSRRVQNPPPTFLVFADPSSL